MKTILYTFIAIFVFGILRPAFTGMAAQQDSLILQATDNKASIMQLELAAKIISGRLADFSSEKFEVKILPEKNQITIQTASIQDRKNLEKLVIQKGALGFYENYDGKPNGLQSAVITGTDIESVKSSQDQNLKSPEILINLKPAAVKLWAEVTRRNRNHVISIVLDGEVLAAPVVRSVMENGKCSITGNYTPDEARWIAAIGNNGELPLTFTVVK